MTKDEMELELKARRHRAGAQAVSMWQDVQAQCSSQGIADQPTRLAIYAATVRIWAALLPSS